MANLLWMYFFSDECCGRAFGSYLREIPADVSSVTAGKGYSGVIFEHGGLNDKRSYRSAGLTQRRAGKKQREIIAMKPYLEKIESFRSETKGPGCKLNAGTSDIQLSN